jgi:hypothetical protein
MEERRLCGLGDLMLLLYGREKNREVVQGVERIWGLLLLEIKSVCKMEEEFVDMHWLVLLA